MWKRISTETGILAEYVSSLHFRFTSSLGNFIIQSSWINDEGVCAIRRRHRDFLLGRSVSANVNNNHGDYGVPYSSRDELLRRFGCFAQVRQKWPMLNNVKCVWYCPTLDLNLLISSWKPMSVRLSSWSLSPSCLSHRYFRRWPPPCLLRHAVFHQSRMATSNRIESHNRGADVASATI